ncbi:MAG: hypothetical protein JSV63_01395 [Candidatus Aenigmatarchaeota archaeon]|nr:MAG: hypothetical protein JSV63_01395 [Candidatus Aenigmarchaeota archaeon]
MIELERTFLAKHLPEGFEKLPNKEVIDIYHPKEADHPVLRLRKDGDKYELTKKSPVRSGDASDQREQTITLTKEEFRKLSQLEGKRVEKVRYYYDYNGRKAEIDVFKGALEGLVLVDFEFTTHEEKDSFEMPEFCLADVTHEVFIAGGMLCGKKFADIEAKLGEFGYQKPL